MVRPPAQPVAGVCAAVADRSGLDRTLVRILMVVFSVVFSPVFYGLGWLLLPDHEGRIELEGLINGRIGAGAIGGTALFILGLQPAPLLTGDGPPAPLIAVGIGLAAWFLIMYRRDQHEYGRAPVGGTRYPVTAPVAASPGAATAAGPPPGRSRQPSHPQQPPFLVRRPRLSGPVTASVVAAGVLVGAITGLAFNAIGPDDLSSNQLVSVGAGAGAATLALGVIGAGLAGRSAGLLTVLTAVSLLLGAAGTMPRFDFQPRFGDQSATPSVLRDMEFTSGFGNLELDLTKASVPENPASTPHLQVSSQFGNVTVIVPKDLAVDMTLDNHFGDTEGAATNGRIGPAGPADARLEVSDTFGRVLVRQED